MGFYDVGLTYNPNHVKGTMSESDLQELVSGKWPGSEQDRAVQTALCESSGNTAAINGDHYGLYQIEGVNVRCVSCLYDPVYNANVASRMWKARGWEPWQCGDPTHPLPSLKHPGGPGNEADIPPEDITGQIGQAGGNALKSISSIGDFFGNINLTSLLKMLLGGALLIVGSIYFLETFLKSAPVQKTTSAVGTAAEVIK